MFQINFKDPGIQRHRQVRRACRVGCTEACAQQPFKQKQATILALAIDHCVTQGVEELDTDKLTSLLKLRYNPINDAIAKLGNAVLVRQAFVGMQRYLYSSQT